MTSHGVDSSASCLAATGRITSAANLRHRALNSRCSSLYPKSILPSVRSAAGMPGSPAYVVSIDWSVNQQPVLPLVGTNCRSAGGDSRRPGSDARRYVHAVAADWRRRLAVIGAAILVVLGARRRRRLPPGRLAARRRDRSRLRRRASSSTSSRRRRRQDLGFPAFATKNTTRVARPRPRRRRRRRRPRRVPLDRGRRRAPPPSPWSTTTTGPRGSPRPASLAQPIGAPILLTGTDDSSRLHREALSALAPPGSEETDGEQVFAIGAATAPAGPRARARRPAPTRPRSPPRSTGCARG